MKKIILFIRLMHINFILIKHGLDKIVLSIPLFAPISFIAYFNPYNWRRKDVRTSGQRIREALIELGPIFVKFGQTLSTRSDLLPDEIAEELKQLQDRVPPFASETAIALVEKTYGDSIDNLFITFDPIPIASASIAQVHQVTLKNGKTAVLKIVRPKIEKYIKRDVDLLYALAKLAERYWNHGNRIHPVKIVNEFEHVILNELDLMREAANASQLRRNFENSSILYIPEVYWPYARSNIIAMEKISGVPVSDIKTLKQHHVNLKLLAERGVTIFFTQVFRDNFFHADMHPGNIFIDIKDPEDPRYIAVDFGIIGSLTPEDQYYLAANFFAFFNRDYKKVAELHRDSGWIPANTSLVEFEAMIRTLCEPIFEKPLYEISFGRTLMRLLQMGRAFDMEVQPQLVLLQKTLISIEGLGRHLYPQLDLWSTARPFLQKWLMQQSSPSNFLKKLRLNFPKILDELPDLPILVYENLVASKMSKYKNLSSDQNTKNTTVNKRYLGAGIAFIISAIYFLIFNLIFVFPKTPTLIISITLSVLGLWLILSKEH